MSEMGKLGTFVWFFGVVEDVDDPLQVGRVRVRPYNFYTTNSTLLPTDDLPWAHVVMPNTSASFNEKGSSPTFLMVGATVFGFFADDGNAQMPVILGSYPGIPQPNPDFVDSQNLSTDNHDVNRLARGVNKLNEPKSQVGIDDFEPPPNVTFGARYPFNKVFESERGHIVEFDDTPGSERIHIYHNSGHYTEMVAGMRTDKVNGDHIEISMRDRYIKVNGNMAVIVEGTTTIASKGAVAISSEKQISMVAPIINISASLGLTLSGGASLSATASVSTITGMLGLFLNPGIGVGT
jgi:hypothetical protein